MVFQETILVTDAAINAETDALEIDAGSGATLTTRTGYGRPKILAAAAWCSTNDVEKVTIHPSGYADANGIPVPLVGLYAATSSFRLADAKLCVPVELPETCALTMNATSETAAGTVVYGWILLEYPSGGKMQPIMSGPGYVRRAWEAGGALTSQVVLASTAITDLSAGTMYQPCGVGNVGVNGATAGIVGPAFIRFTNPEMEGANLWIPLCNNAAYCAGLGKGIVKFSEVGIKMPVFAGGTNFTTACIGYTAEQPQGEIEFVVNKKLFP